MARHSHPVWAAAMSLLLATSLISITGARTAQAAPAQSAQDKAKACNDRADQKGLKGSDRQTFMQSCLNKAADTGSSPNVSQQDKAKTCNNLADRKNLTGSDRRSYVKDCMKKANPQ
jgi:hypothetical protein